MALRAWHSWGLAGQLHFVTVLVHGVIINVDFFSRPILRA
jgi:hypothetical protein